MEKVRVYRIPPCRMASSGRGMFGDGTLEAFSEWFGKFPAEAFPRDYLWFDGQGFVWYYMLRDGMDAPEAFEVVDFPGGLYAVATGKDNDHESYVETMAAIEAFIAGGPYEKDPDRAELGNIITPPEVRDVLGYEQMDYYTPIRVKHAPELWDVVDAQGNPVGRTHEKGKPMREGDYHRSVSVWLANEKGEFLISRRVDSVKVAAGMWETTGGSVVAGEDSLGGAIREVREELGVELQPENGREMFSYTWPHSSGDGAAYITVWVFRQEIDIGTIRLQAGETCEAAWVTKDRLLEMIRAGEFIAYTYIEDLFRFVGENGK